MSGGVDSSVTAALLAQKVIQVLLIIKGAVLTAVAQDYDLSAVFMRNWDTRDESGTDRGCEWEQDWEDVQGVCKILDVPCDLVRSAPSNLSTPLKASGGPLASVLESRLPALLGPVVRWSHSQSRCFLQPVRIQI